MQPSEKSKLSSTLLNKGNSNIQYGGITEDGVPLILDKFEKSRCSKCSFFLRSLTIEPATFAYMFAMMLNMSTLSNLIMDKGCLYHFNYTKEVCNNLSAHHDEKNNVEIFANNYVLYGNLMSLLGAVSMLFIAPWSDKYGRKIPLILSCVGSIASDVGILLCIIYFESNVNYLILSKLPTEIVGGFISFLTIVYSHAAEVSTEQNRTLKYTTIEITFMLALATGGLVGGMIYKYYGYFYVYLTGLVLHYLSVLWIVFVVEETKGLDESVTWKEKNRYFFRLDSVTKSWSTTVKPRENGGRFSLILLFLSMCVVILTYEVFGGLGFLYAHHIYNWDPPTYQSVNTVFSLITFVMITIAGFLFMKKLKLADSVLGIIGTLSMMGKNFLIAFAKYSIYIYYAGNIAGCLSGLTTLAIRAGISKIIDKEETGLVFSCLATCEAAFPMIGSTLVTKVYNATIDINPSVTYLMSVGFLFLTLGTFIWIFVKSRMERKYPRKEGEE